MSEHLKAIEATIPEGDPASVERMVWVQAACDAIAKVMLERRGGNAQLALTGVIPLAAEIGQAIERRAKP